MGDVPATDQPGPSVFPVPPAPVPPAPVPPAVVPSAEGAAATLSTWLLPEHLRWAVRHVPELIPTEPIAAAPAPRALGPATDPGLLDLVVACHDGPRRLEDRLLGGREDALVVLHRGRLAAEWYAPGVPPDDRHLVFSITKSVTGLLAGALAGAGLLDLEAPVGQVLPGVAGPGFAGATVRHLLDMEASYAFVEDYSPGPDIVAYRHAAGWYPAPAGSPALREFLGSCAADGQHGERFRYLSPTIDLLGMVCAEAAGSTWAQAVSRYLWAPLGAEDGADVTLDREGTPRAAGGMCAQPRDVARLGQLVADGGLRDGQAIVPAAFVDDLTRGGSRGHWDAGDFADFLPGGAYRSCWYQPRVDPDVVVGIGIHGQLLYVDRARDVVVAVLSSWTEPDVDEWHHDHLEAARTIARSLGDRASAYS